MFERFTDGARQAVVLAQEWAVEQRHQGVSPADLLVGVAGTEGSAAAALADVELPPDRVRRSVLAVQPPGSGPAGRRIPFSPGAKKALELALREALRLSDRDIDTGHLLLGVLATGGDDLDRVLAEAEIDPVRLRAATEHRLAARPAARHPAVEPDRLLRLELLLTDIQARLDRIERRLGGS